MDIMDIIVLVLVAIFVFAIYITRKKMENMKNMLDEALTDFAVHIPNGLPIDDHLKLFTSQFNDFCKKTFRKDMAELEKIRHKYISAVFAIAAVWTVIYIIICIYSYHIWEPEINNVLQRLLLLGYVLAYIPIIRYKNQAKELIIPKLLSFIGNFRLQKTHSTIKILREYVKALKLFQDSNRINSFITGDILKGTYKNIKVSIAEIDYGARSNHNPKGIFVKGILLKFKSFKKFKGETIIKYNGTNLLSKKSSKVNLEAPEFEKIYDVYSTDQIEARYLITPALMKRLVELNNNYYKNLTLSFEQGNVNIAVHSSIDWFEFPFFKPTNKISNYREILADLLHILSIIDDLKLDQNIGM